MGGEMLSSSSNAPSLSNGPKFCSSYSNGPKFCSSYGVSLVVRAMVMPPALLRYNRAARHQLLGTVVSSCYVVNRSPATEPLDRTENPPKTRQSSARLRKNLDFIAARAQQSTAS